MDLLLFLQSDDAGVVYRELITHPAGMDRAEIARARSWSAERAAEALDRLLSAGLVEQDDADQGRFHAVPPRLAADSALASVELDLEKLRHQVETDRTAVSELARIRQEHLARETITRLDGLTVFRLRLSELIDSAEDECTLVLPSGCDQSILSDALISPSRAVAAAGLPTRTRVIAQESAKRIPKAHVWLRQLSRCGVQIRLQPVVPTFMLVVDRQVVILPVDVDDVIFGGIELEQPALVTALCAWLEHEWSSAAPYGEAPPTEVAELAEREKALLSLLADGKTDSVIARQLGVSVRTERTLVAGLMSKVGARNRFQLAWRATERGWL